MNSLEKLATRLLFLLTETVSLEGRSAFVLSARFVFIADGQGDGTIKNVFNTNHFLAATLHVGSTHLLSNGTALLFSDGSKTLRFEELDARSLVAQI